MTAVPQPHQPTGPDGARAEHADELLQSLPVALVGIGDDGVIGWCNAEARAVLGPAAVPGLRFVSIWNDAAAAAAAVGARVGAGAAAPVELALREPSAAGTWVEVVARSAPGGGVVLVLRPADAQRAARVELERLNELVAMARDFGRIGLWERDMRTLEGRWDDQVRQFWGMAPGQQAPDFEAAADRIVDADRPGLIRRFRESLKQPGRHAIRYRVRNADGTLRSLHSQWIVKSGSDGIADRVVGLVMDDTEAFRLAQSASELESQLAIAVEVGEIAIWRYDFATGRTRFNDQALRLAGLQSRDDGMSVDEVTALIHPRDRQRAMEWARGALSGNGAGDIDLRYRRSDGVWRTMMTRRFVQRDASGRAVAFIGVGLDVTARRDADLALRSATERVALATHGAGLATWERDLETGETYWDPQMFTLRGHAPREHAMNADERLACVHPDDRAATLRHRAQIRDGLATDQQFRVVHPDGQVRWLASRSVDLRDPATGGRRRIGVNWDITDHRTADAVRQEREIALRESEAKSRFMARMSHELRTPLNAVLGFAHLLLADELASPGPAQVPLRRQRIEHIADAGRHLLSLINDVLDLTSLEGGEVVVDLQPVSLAAVVAETLTLLEGPIRDAAVTIVCADIDVGVMADVVRLRQVLLNLLSNAVKYNREGGHVTISAAPAGADVVLSVADSGRGMDAQQLQHLFEPFNRLGRESGAVEGSGIGLAIVKSLVDRMGGSVVASSVPGTGSVFEVRLPAARDVDRATPGPVSTRADPAAAQSTATAPSAPATAASAPLVVHRLLYIEDNPVNAMIIGELLARRADIELHVAVDGAGGVAMAADVMPELILLDMQLPDCDGGEVLARLRANPATRDIPCIALSANAMPDDIDRAMRAGVVDYWTKPLDFAQFLAALDRRLGAGPVVT